MSGDNPSPEKQVLAPLWSIQVYVTFGATASSDPDLPTQLRDNVIQMVVEPYPLRFDTYFLPNADRESCMTHYRAEKAARADTHFDIVPQYDKNYCGFMVILDDPDWQNAKAQVLQFDPLPELRVDPEDPACLAYEFIDERVRVKSDVMPRPFPVLGIPWTAEDARKAMEQFLVDVIRDLTFTVGFRERRERYQEAIDGGKESW
ncbi:hypothetical protein K431DRAFT_289199 [Polychaeton citri CBS 116435]|uniref:Uncharacterized protein n=1 Tax=Polychaeton citri CBS 116435 TaxID=1314669 RepID=A0A9P4UKU9_9PEZI|nr:hypothetical protein K431DRAFT_289199 [Polychaeton citri CBS 116435]